MKVFNKKKIRNLMMAFAIIISTGSIVMVATPQTAFAAAPQTCNKDFLGFPQWYRGLTKAWPNCDIKSPTKFDTAPTKSDGLSIFIWVIAINVLQMAIVLVVYIASFFFLYGGWLFIFSQGKPEGIAKGKSTMTMALIGLVVSVISVALVNYIWSNIINTITP